MTLDTTPIQEGVTTFISNVFVYLPLGLAIVGIPAAIVGGMKFGGSLVKMVLGALGGIGGGR
jgi:hypothetical protein